MIENDTIQLLRECDSGIQMGVSAIDDTMKYVKSDKLKKILADNKQKHNSIANELVELLNIYHDEGKHPPLPVQAMSKLKSNVKLSFEGSDNAAAEYIFDGCAMGIKSLSRYLNQYAAADERSKDFTQRLISLEQKLSHDMRGFL